MMVYGPTEVGDTNSPIVSFAAIHRWAASMVLRTRMALVFKANSDRVPQRGVGLVFLGRAGYRGQAAKAGMLTVRSSLNGAMVSRVM